MGYEPIPGVRPSLSRANAVAVLVILVFNAFRFVGDLDGIPMLLVLVSGMLVLWCNLVLYQKWHSLAFALADLSALSGLSIGSRSQASRESTARLFRTGLAVGFGVSLALWIRLTTKCVVLPSLDWFPESHVESRSWLFRAFADDKGVYFALVSALYAGLCAMSV